VDQPTRKPRSKSIFQSKTFWGAIATFAVAIQPAVEDIVGQLQPDGVNKYLQLALLSAGTIATIYGRYSAEAEITTPEWLPGRSDH